MAIIPNSVGDAVGKMFKPSKRIIVDAPATLFKGAKTTMWKFPKAMMSKKGLGLFAGLIAAVAAIGGLASWAKRSSVESAQEQEAADLKQSIAENKAARVDTSVAMGENGNLPYRNDWRAREKGGLPGLPPTV